MARPLLQLLRRQEMAINWKGMEIRELQGRLNSLEVQVRSAIPEPKRGRP
jgi:hypothetical protein